jgi:hypothetical protein
MAARAAGRRRLEVLDVEPLRTGRRAPAAAACALRIAERQSHLEREIGAQEIRQVGAVGAKHGLHRVLAETQMIEQHIARLVAQPHVQRRPRQLSVKRIVKQLFDPGGEQVFGCPVPRVADRPDASFDRAGRCRPVAAHRDFAGDGAAAGRRQRHAPFARGRRGHFGEPGIGRAAVLPARFRCDRAVRRDQRQLAVERLLRGEDDAQRRALPRRDRRGQHRDAGVVAAGGTLRPCVRARQDQGSACACNQQQAYYRGKPASGKHVAPPSIPQPSSCNDHGERSG